MVISIIGTGYVGLVSAAVLADLGNIVSCIDIDEKKITSLKKNKVPFFEPGLEELVKKNSEAKRLTFTTNYIAVKDAEVIFICVGTPSKEDGTVLLKYLFSAAKSIAQNITKDSLIVIKSTVPIGIEKEIKQIFSNYTNRVEFAQVPEFLREGSAVKDSLNPDRIVIGTETTKAQQKLLNLFKPFPGGRILTDIKSAQMIKYASNSLLATKISFANAVALLCEKTGADALEVLKGVGLDPRIGQNFLSPGVGFGGSCFPKDLAAFINIAKNFDYDFKLLKSVVEINNLQIEFFIKKITTAVKNIKGKRLAVLGIAFKPNTDDLREAPSIKIINRLLNLGAKITAYDPIAIANAKKVFGSNIEYAKDAYLAAKDANGLLIITEWNEFRELDLAKIKSLMKTATIFDGRNIYDPKDVKALGFKYFGVGRS